MRMKLFHASDQQQIGHLETEVNGWPAALPAPTEIFAVNTCPYHKLNPAVLVMETAEGRSRYDPTEQLDWSMDRSVLAQRQMSASLIIVGHIRPQDSPQVSFPEDDHIVEAFPPDRADEPLDIS